jgi:hypothetical protein
MRRKHLELGVAGKMVVGEINDRFSRCTRSRDLFLDDRDDARHRWAAVERAALVDEVFDHVDDDERSFHQVLPVGERVYITSAKENAADAGDV